MHITLIGMSSIGKSHWAKRLASEGGFEWIDCDFLIEQKLAPELKRLGYTGLEGVAKWMGYPYDGRYAEASQKYLACERDVMHEVVKRLQTEPPQKPVVVDTTGSMIYVGDIDEDAITRLRSLTRFIYFDASLDHMAELFEQYLLEPKPVIWGDAFQPHPSEAPQDSLKRCYPDLLKGRAERYAELAHITIPYELHRASDATPGTLFGNP